MKEAKVISLDDIEGYHLGDKKTDTLRTIKNVLHSNNMRVHQGIFPAKQASSKHSHPYSEEMCYIIRGQGEVTIGEETRQLGSNIVVFIPPGIPHIYRNTGEKEMILIAVYSPPTDIPSK